MTVGTEFKESHEGSIRLAKQVTDDARQASFPS